MSCKVFLFHHLQIEDKRKRKLCCGRSLLANFFCDWGPSRVMASSFMRFLYHTRRRRTSVSRIPLYEWTARLSHLYLTTHNTQHTTQQTHNTTDTQHTTHNTTNTQHTTHNTTDTQHTTHNTTDTHPCRRRNSDPQFLRASCRRRSPYAAWPVGPTSFTISLIKYIN